MRFEWDERKSFANQRKHGVSFHEAETAFYDENAIIYDDPDHSVQEHHFVLLGVSIRLRVLVVVHCLRHDDEVIRIISARKATSNERAEYPGGAQ
jgi:uncharacterized DUF497 family protein